MARAPLPRCGPLNWRICRVFTLLLVATVPNCGRGEPGQSQFVVQPAKSPDATAGAAPLFTIDLKSSSARLDRLSSHRVQVDDPVYQRSKSYDGFRLSEIVDHFAPARTRVSDDAHLVMVCLDGYWVPLTMRLARNGGGILARRDTEAASDWEELPPGTAVGSPAPFYLVWEPAASSAGAHLPWPYGVIAIEVWSSDPSDQAKPSSTANRIVKGYEVFMQKCINCHRINGAGGTLAAELNTPVNVTEYWNLLALKQFILDPASIRAQSQMPKIHSLTTEEVDAVMAYLEHMKYQKLVRK